MKTCKQEVDERPSPDSFIISFPTLETFRPRSGTWGCPALHFKKTFFFLIVFRFLRVWSFFCFFLKNNKRCVAFLITFPLLNKTNCFILHNTIKPLHVQYQCPITDYMYGKLHVSQISCIKKNMSFIYWKTWT